MAHSYHGVVQQGTWSSDLIISSLLEHQRARLYSLSQLQLSGINRLSIIRLYLKT